MPVNRRYDFSIKGFGFLLARGQGVGRAWQRTGRADTPGQRSATDAEYGVLPDELDHPEVWNDWSGGFGYPYRDPANPNTYHWAQDFECRFPHQLIHCQQPQLLPAFYASMNTNVYRFYDGVIPTNVGGTAGEIVVGVKGGRAWFDPTGLNTIGSMFAPAADYSWNLNLSGRSAIFGAATYIGAQSGNFLRRASSDGAMSLASMPGLHFVVGGNRLWRAHGALGREFLLQSCAAGADPMVAANWSATIAIGNQWMPISDLETLEDQVFAGLPNGLYAGDSSGTFVNIMGNTQFQTNPDNFRDLDIYQSGIAAPYAGGIVLYRQSDYTALVEDIGPTNASSRSPISGRFRALKDYGNWLFAGRWTGSQSYLMAGRPGSNGWQWHNLQKLPHVAAIGRIHFDGVTTNSAGQEINTRCWVACDPNLALTAPLYVWPIPSQDGNPLASNSLFTPNYCSTARIDLGAVDWGAPGTLKIFRSVEMWADNLKWNPQFCDVYYTVDNGERKYLGKMTKSPKDTLYFPGNEGLPRVEGSFVTGQSIELSLESFTGSAAITPVYRSIILRGALQPRSVDLITAVVRIGDNLRDRQGGAMRSGATQLDELRALGDPDRDGLQAHELIDLAGATQWVKVLGRVEEQEAYQQGNDNPEIAATVRMAVLSFTTNPILT
mgnify:CR=1 FL=1